MQGMPEVRSIRPAVLDFKGTNVKKKTDEGIGVAKVLRIGVLVLLFKVDVQANVLVRPTAFSILDGGGDIDRKRHRRTENIKDFRRFILVVEDIVRIGLYVSGTVFRLETTEAVLSIGGVVFRVRDILPIHKVRISFSR